MNCCTPNGLDKMFGESTARGDAKTYLKKGIDKQARLVVDALTAQGISGSTVLDVGSGAGGLHIELLKSGAARATSVDLSPAYVDAAREVAARTGFAEAVDHRLLDFAQQAGEVEPADVVVMNRVVCCYPDMPALVRPAAEHARRLLALVFPRNVWWMRLGGTMLNAWMALTRSAFRLYLHPPDAIVSTVKGAGMAPVFEKLSGPWHIVVFRRGEPTA
ncbi:MAG TPA: methyltransferase [Anaerolineae bacterium]|nr:methyltransferase [Anaerolineae bacterium]